MKLNGNSVTVYDRMLSIELNEVKERARLTIFKNSNANFDAELMQCNNEINRIKVYCDRIGALSDRAKQETKEKQLIAMKLTENRKPVLKLHVVYLMQTHTHPHTYYTYAHIFTSIFIQYELLLKLLLESFFLT